MNVGSKYQDFFDAIFVMELHDCLVWDTRMNNSTPAKMCSSLNVYRHFHGVEGKVRVLTWGHFIYVIRVE